MRKSSYLFFMLLLSSLCGCDMLLSANSEFRPLNPPFMPGPPQGGPAEFQQGWKDGCDTGKAQHGSDVYRTSYKFYQNPSLVTNPIYYKAWKDAENYCRTYIFEYAFRSTYIYCSVDGLQNECADLEKTPGPFMGNVSSADVGKGVFYGGGAGVGSVMGNPKEGSSKDIGGVIGTGEDTPFMGSSGDGEASFLGAW